MEVKKISDKEYFGIHGFSNSAAKLILQSPKHYKSNDFSGSEATRIGTALHAHFLNEKWDEEIKVWNDTKTLGIKAKAFVDLHKDFTVITKHEADKAEKIYSQQDEDFKKFFKKTENELAIIGEIEGITVKCKIDAYYEKMGTLYDVKSTMSVPKFIKNFYELGYHTQAAWYLKLAKLAGLKADKFVFYVVESSNPYCYKMITVSREVLDDGEEDIERAFQAYKKCVENNNWSEGYSDNIYEIKRPYWRKNNTETL